MRNVRTLATLVAVVCWLGAPPAVASLVISEFMSINQAAVPDEDGDFRDWVEIYNTGDTAVELSGWSLTDNPNLLNKWQFPDMSLGAGNFLLVFASGKDRGDPAGQLHASFKSPARANSSRWSGPTAPSPRSSVPTLRRKCPMHRMGSA